jgi:hypothetical protein
MTGRDGTKASLTKASLTPPGVVRVTPSRNGRWLVEIGRERYPKRLNVSRTEAAELVRVLTAEVLTADRPA